VNVRTGRIWPPRWTVAHDCGLIVNPDNLRLVIEGNIVPATRPVATAIANAVFDATGLRLRQTPLSPQRVRAALSVS
jgi:CO/xanthine dehydrogenase Mo-binding subunit